MAINIIREVWDNAPAKGGALLVLIALADHAGKDDRRCWPSLARLADMARLSVRQVRSCLRELEMAGIISTLAGRGRGGSNFYYITEVSAWPKRRRTKEEKTAEEKTAEEKTAEEKTAEEKTAERGGSGLPGGEEVGFRQTVREPLKSEEEDACARRDERSPDAALDVHEWTLNVLRQMRLPEGIPKEWEQPSVAREIHGLLDDGFPPLEIVTAIAGSFHPDRKSPKSFEAARSYILKELDAFRCERIARLKALN